MSYGLWLGEEDGLRCRMHELLIFHDKVPSSHNLHTMILPQFCRCETATHRTLHDSWLHKRASPQFLIATSLKDWMWEPSSEQPIFLRLHCFSAYIFVFEYNDRQHQFPKQKNVSWLLLRLNSPQMQHSHSARKANIDIMGHHLPCLEPYKLFIFHHQRPALGCSYKSRQQSKLLSLIRNIKSSINIYVNIYENSGVKMWYSTRLLILVGYAFKVFCYSMDCPKGLREPKIAPKSHLASLENWLLIGCSLVQLIQSN